MVNKPCARRGATCSADTGSLGLQLASSKATNYSRLIQRFGHRSSAAAAANLWLHSSVIPSRGREPWVESVLHVVRDEYSYEARARSGRVEVIIADRDSLRLSISAYREISNRTVEVARRASQQGSVSHLLILYCHSPSAP
ncbi:expressed unknown protein [Seminavis robusta]|uniref:Uncharacterized protein n=1 Tax=Seminavis robusta TaxID=568900 RepID=A0A9N8DR84_9STRA|nr:expressed unknown protein [Seminavis robusta]|eukprot:Sro281_g107311.1  (141) ;mRNA; f:45664-46086